jgi:AcrR family transcriptional regulator
MAATRELIQERGLDVSLNEVADRAGVTRMTLYRHFGPRRELLLEVLLEEMAVTAAACDRLLNDPTCGMGKRVHRTMTYLSTEFRSIPLIAGVVSGSTITDLEELDPDGAVHALVVAIAGPFLDEAHRAGVLRGTPDTAVIWIARQLVAMLYEVPHEGRDPQSVADEIATYFIPSLLINANDECAALVGTYPDLTPAVSSAPLSPTAVSETPPSS